MRAREFLKTYLPFLLSFLCGRLILQTDLVIVSRLGESATAAFGIPMRIMVLDMIAAFAIAPVVSVLVASARGAADRRLQVSASLRTTAVAGVALAAVGLWFYPFLMERIVPAGEVRNLAADALFWLTLAIPSRMIQFAGAMALHGSGQGRKAVLVTFGELALNLLLDLYLVFHVGLGFKGVYLGTFACSWVSLAATLFLLRSQLSLATLISWSGEWVADFFRKAGYEVLRLSGERASALLKLWMFSAVGVVSTGRLSAFSVATEALFLAYVPCIAAMRAFSVMLAPEGDRPARELLRESASVSKAGLLLFGALALVIAVWGGEGGKLFYGLSAEAMRWWLPFAMAFGIALPLRWIDSVLRGIWLAKKDFRVIAQIDLATEWAIVVPVTCLGVYFDHPGLAWSAFVLGEMISVIYLLVKIRGSARLEGVAFTKVM